MTGQILQQNKKKYDEIYTNRQVFLKYPADWIIRFHNMYMKEHIPTGKVLDYGCGSGNNSAFFLEQGYDVHGTEITEAALPLIAENVGATENFLIIDPDATTLPFEDNSFDFIFSNQVLYYLGSGRHIQAVCQELKRCLRPGGVFFTTMMGPKNYYITDYSKKIDQNIYEVKIGGDHRLSGDHEVIFVVESEEHLKSTFSDFAPLTVGYFDQRMFDLTSNFHWIFAGTKSD